MSTVDRKRLASVDDLAPMWGALVGMESGMLYDLNLSLSELPTPGLNVCMASNVDGQDMPLLTRVRSMPRRQWIRQGRSPLDVERFRVTCVDIIGGIQNNIDAGRDSKGRWFEYLPAKNGWRYGRAGHGRVRVDHLKDGAHRIAIVAMAVAEQRFVNWRVSMAIDGLPSISFMTDQTGIRAAFGLRDVGATGRRNALIHWVKGHHRTRRGSDADATWVRRHLRGGHSFSWHGVECTVRPAAAEFDPSWSGADLADTRRMVDLSSIASGA